MRFEQFAQRLAERAKDPLSFKDVVALSINRFRDIGAIPTEGDPAAAMAHVLMALEGSREPWHFGRLVLYAGFLVERGARAVDAARIVAERLPHFVELAAVAAGTAIDENQEPMIVAENVWRSNAQAASALLAMDTAVPGAMTLFLVDNHALRLVRRHTELLRDIKIVEQVLDVGYYLVQLLESSDNLKIIAINPSARQGFIIVADNVRNGFQLFTLFEGALPDRYRQRLADDAWPNSEEMAICRGETLIDGKYILHARFDYFNWSAWEDGDFVVDAPTRWIWGELPLKYIPKIDGYPVILFGDSRYRRTWDASLVCRVHPLMRSSLNFEGILDVVDVTNWLRIIASAPKDARENMRYAGVALPS